MADLEHVISDALNDAGDVGADDSPATDTASGETPAADPATPASSAPAEEDPFAKEHGLVTRRPDGRENRIPYSRVKAINQRAIEKAKAEWEGSLAQERQELARLREYQKALEPFESVVDVDGDRLIQALAARNPALYGKFAKVLEQAAAAAAVAPEDQDPRPEPDFDLGDGRLTYSDKGFEKLRAWDRRQAVREAEERIAKRLKPIEDEREATRKQMADRQRQQHLEREAGAHVDKLLDRMRKLPGFTEHEAEILTAFKADPTATVHDAYLTVMLPKFQAGKTQMRTEVLDEIKRTPRKTSESGGAVDEGERPQSIEDLIRASVAGLK